MVMDVKTLSLDPNKRAQVRKAIQISKAERKQKNYFRGGDRFERTMEGWNPRIQSADLDLVKYRDKITARARDLARNGGYAQSVINSYLDNSIGGFFKLSPQPAYKLLGRDAEWSHDFSSITKQRFDVWANSVYNYPDFYAESNFVSLLKQSTHAAITGGECLALVRFRKRGRYRTKIQLIEAERISTPPDRARDKTIVNGVQLNEAGQVTGYWIQTTHPSETIGRGEWQFINKFNRRGRKQVIHLFDKERPEQHRGKSIFAPIIQQFKLLDNYKITESDRAIAQAMFAAVITSNLPSADAFYALGATGLDENTNAYEYFTELQADFKESTGGITLNGSKIAHLAANEKLDLLRSDAPNSGYGQFVDSNLREVAAGSGVSYEQISKDYSKTTYASARTAMIEAWKRFMCFKETFPAKLASEIYSLWLEEDLDFVSGYPDASVARFTEFPEAWVRASWISAGRGEIDPLKQSQASENNLRIGRTTREIEAAELGYDIDELFEKQAFEKKMMEELGLTSIDSVPRQDTNGDNND